jgi:type II secretory pathway pseudopilin PulG
MKLKGTTLLELIIVMGVIAAVFGLGIAGLIKFQGTAEVQSVYSDFISNIKTLQNKAKNSVNAAATHDKAPYVYAVIFNQNKYTFYNCDKATSTTLICTEDTSNPEVLLSIKHSTLSNQGCDAVGFTRLTGDIISINTTNFTYNTTGACSYTFLQTSAQVTKDVNINLTSNSID